MRIRHISSLALLLPLVAAPVPAANDIQTSGSFVSTVAPGTPPLEVASTTRVDNLNAEYLDGWSAASFLRPLANVITVSPSGGDFTSIQAALNSIGDASESNRYLVLVGPGTYVGKVTLKSWVRVIGAGRGLTTIESDGGVFDSFSATVAGADNAELRNLTVLSDASSSGFQYAVGVLAYETRPYLRDLEIIAYGGGIQSIGILNGNRAAALQVVDSAVRGSNSTDAFGILNQSASLEVTRSEVRGYLGTNAGYGIFNSASSGSYLVTVLRSYVQGEHAVMSSDSEFTTRFLRVDMAGPSVIDNGGTTICALVVDTGGTVFTDTCP
jgi:hypothetical protein